MLIALLASIVPALEPALAPKKGTLWLRSAVDESSLICIGHVEEVRRVKMPPAAPVDPWAEDWADRTPAEAPFARLRIERVLKGDASTAVVQVEAWSTWTCDTTSVPAGLRGVFFLAGGVVASMSDGERASIALELGGGPVLRAIGSGDGVVAIEGEEARESVWFAAAPASLKPAPPPVRPESLRVELDAARIELSRFSAYVTGLARFDTHLLAVHAEVRDATGVDGRPFDLRILPSGEARLTTGSFAAEVVEPFRLETDAWLRLRAGLALLEPGPELERDPDAWRPGLRRTLSTLLDSRSIAFWDFGQPDPETASGAERASYRAGIRAWTLVSDAMRRPDCADFRALDASWLAY